MPQGAVAATRWGRKAAIIAQLSND